jgi:cytoplasmic iron level regulating protein YaaA (DUF328/UPF0246 family)
MLMVISPAKDLDFSSAVPELPYTQPDMLTDAAALVEICRQLTPMQLSQLMDISDKLAGLNAARFGSWQLPFHRDNARAALFAFNGDVYQGLAAQSLTTEQLHYAQQHLRILSGLYGVLRPFDLMQAYRLEMGTALANPRGKDLYQFWGDQITAALNEQLESLNASCLLNLASQEYFKAVKPKALTRPLIDVTFKDQKNGQYKIISFFAKRARGLMARYVLTEQVREPAALTGFNLDRYYYAPAQSTANHLVFLRDEVPA